MNVNVLSTNLFQDVPIFRELIIYPLFFTKIINAPKKQDENLTEEEKLDRSVSAVYITSGLCLNCFGFYTLNLQLLIFFFCHSSDVHYIFKNNTFKDT